MPNKPLLLTAYAAPACSAAEYGVLQMKFCTVLINANVL